MTWAGLNEALKACGDERVLARMLKEAVADGRASRARRVYGRLSAVRRAREVRDLAAGCATARAARKEAA